jgi:hypothetical protein
VFTLSSSRDIQTINPNIPAGKTLKVIIPTYVASSYSIVSTETIPNSSGSFIVACDESEPVTISGTTYLNYGAYVYKREANNSYTKTTSATINGTSYTLYGGDGINSSGIVLLEVILEVSTFSSATFSVESSKTLIDASFEITTRPTSNSTGAITYSSSNPAVATIDASGNWITLVGVGDVSFNATQAQTAQYLSATKASNTLTVSKATPTLAFVSPPTTKTLTDAAFTVVASSASSGAVTYSSSNTSFATVGASTGLVTLKAAGTVTITAAQAASALYNAPTNTTCSIVISAAGSELAGQTIPPGTSFAGLNLSGASLVGTTLSGVSFSGATLTNVDFSGATITGTNFTNANISGATNLPEFSTVQKLQLLKNINNAAIEAVQVTATVAGSVINSLLAAPISRVAESNFTIKSPSTVDASANKLVTVNSFDISGGKSIYIPMNANETVKINNVIYSFNGTNILDASGNVVTYASFAGAPFKIYVGSVVAVNIQNTLNKITVLGDGLYDILTELFVFKSE